MPFVQRITSSQLQLPSTPAASWTPPAQRTPGRPLPDRVEPRDRRPAFIAAAAVAAAQLVPGVAEGEALGAAGIAAGAAVRLGAKALAERIAPLAAAGARKALAVAAGMASTYAGDRVAQELLNDDAVPKPVRDAAHAADAAFKAVLHRGLHG